MPKIRVKPTILHKSTDLTTRKPEGESAEDDTGEDELDEWKEYKSALMYGDYAAVKP